MTPAPPTPAALESLQPGEMNASQLDAALAREVLGCALVWWPPYQDWCCDCPGAPHGIDSQCSVTAAYSSDWRWTHEVLAAADVVPTSSSTPREAAIKALKAVRKRRLH